MHEEVQSAERYALGKNDKREVGIWQPRVNSRRKLRGLCRASHPTKAVSTGQRRGMTDEQDVVENNDVIGTSQLKVSDPRHRCH